jgi:hypothetical protein
MSKITKFLESIKENKCNHIANKTYDLFKEIYDRLPIEVTGEFEIYKMIMQYSSEDILSDILYANLTKNIKNIHSSQLGKYFDYDILDRKEMKEIYMSLLDGSHEKYCNFYICNSFDNSNNLGEIASLASDFEMSCLFATYNEVKYYYNEYSYSFIKRISEMDEKIKNKFIKAVIDTLINDENDTNFSFLRLQSDINSYEGRI